MTVIYLWTNALLYGAFALWCTLRWASTSAGIGYAQLTGGGRSEYLAVYGGLQVGMALVYAWLAWRPELHRTGVLFSLLLYVPIVLFRWTSAALLGPVSRTTVVVGVLETVLLACALLLWWFGDKRFVA